MTIRSRRLWGRGTWHASFQSRYRGAVRRRRAGDRDGDATRFDATARGVRQRDERVKLGEVQRCGLRWSSRLFAMGPGKRERSTHPRDNQRMDRQAVDDVASCSTALNATRPRPLGWLGWLRGYQVVAVCCRWRRAGRQKPQTGRKPGTRERLACQIRARPRSISVHLPHSSMQLESLRTGLRLRAAVVGGGGRSRRRGADAAVPLAAVAAATGAQLGL